jgi:hypothetical protein
VEMLLRPHDGLFECREGVLGLTWGPKPSKVRNFSVLTFQSSISITPLFMFARHPLHLNSSRRNTHRVLARALTSACALQTFLREFMGVYCVLNQHCLAERVTLDKLLYLKAVLSEQLPLLAMASDKQVQRILSSTTQFNREQSKCQSCTS